MRSPPPTCRRIARPTAMAAGVTAGALALLASPAAAQQPPAQFPTTGISLWVDAVVAAVVTLLVGGGFVALAPEYTGRTTDRVLETPGETFLYGLGIFIVAIVVVFILAITVVGIVLVVPLAIALVVVAQIGYLAAGRAVADDWAPVLLVAVVVSAVASGVPYLGGLLGFVLGSMGAGAWYLEYRGDGTGSRGGSGFEPSGSRASGVSATGRDAADGWGPNGSGSGASDTTRGSDVGVDGSDSDAAGASADGEAASDADADVPSDEWTGGFDDTDRK